MTFSARVEENLAPVIARKVKSRIFFTILATGPFRFNAIESTHLENPQILNPTTLGRMPFHSVD